MDHCHFNTHPMSEEQLSALLAKLKEDADFRERLKGAGDLDAFVEIAHEAGFRASKEDLLRYKEKLTINLSDEELESMAGADFTAGWCCEVMGSVMLDP